MPGFRGHRIKDVGIVETPDRGEFIKKILEYSKSQDIIDIQFSVTTGTFKYYHALLIFGEL